MPCLKTEAPEFGQGPLLLVVPNSLSEPKLGAYLNVFN